jgi:hypothetical protein
MISGNFCSHASRGWPEILPSGETVYMFAGEVLITAWTLPKGLRPLVRSVG